LWRHYEHAQGLSSRSPDQHRHEPCGRRDQPEAFPKTWPRHWGAQLWAINFLYLPGLRDPLKNRWPNWSGIIIRLTFATFFFSQGDGFIPMGIYDAASGLLLLVTYLPVVRSADAA
jgi:hypothetical protein